jgi:hypothetical protein
MHTLEELIFLLCRALRPNMRRRINNYKISKPIYLNCHKYSTDFSVAIDVANNWILIAFGI